MFEKEIVPLIFCSMQKLRIYPIIQTPKNCHFWTIHSRNEKPDFKGFLAFEIWAEFEFIASKMKI